MAIVGQQSWRDILLTALLASSILYYYFFVVNNSGDDVLRNTNETQVPTSEEERIKRRDHLAKIAEERAKRIAAATAADVESSNNKNSSEQHDVTTTLEETKTKTVASNQVAKKSTIQNNQSSFNINGDKSATNRVTKKVTIDTQKGKADQLKNEENDPKVEKRDVDKSKEVNNSRVRQVESNLFTEKTSANVDISSNEKKVLAALATSSNTKAVQENDQEESLTIYLIKSSSPRIEISIAKDATPSKLRKVVADTTDIPLTSLRLIFRGRMIVEKSTGSVVDEFGIEEGSALHVVGKPQTQTSVSVSRQQQQHHQPRTSPSQQDIMTRVIHQGLQRNPNFFQYAAAAGNYDLIQAAIRDGSFNMQLNRADENDWTSLHEAIRGGHHDVVTLLLDEGGLDMHAITNQGNGFSPLSLSINYHGGEHPLTRMIRDRGGQEVWPEEEGNESSSSPNDESNE
eukprot:scaffold379_cov145-Skeletonema_menzelii.AAC.13